MSYDIDFKVKAEGVNVYLSVGSCTANITWNVRELIKQSSGWEIENEDFNGFVKDLIPKIRNGLTELELYTYKYKQYESSNGWGTVSGVRQFYREIIKSWEDLFNEEPELANIALVYVC